MRMTRFDKPLKAYSVARSPNAEGIMIPTFGTPVSFSGDLQPLARTSSRRAEFGLDSTEANAKVLFFDNDIVLTEGMKLLDQVTLESYMISGSPTVWNGHSEAIMKVWNG